MHRPPGGRDNPLGIDLPRFYYSNAHSLGRALDNVEKLLSPTGRKELGVADGVEFCW